MGMTGTLTVNQLVIISFDIGKETYKQLLMPDGLGEVPNEKPKIAFLRDCLCLFHDHKGTHFVVRQMKGFGVEKSWTQLVGVSYEHLQIETTSKLKPLCIYENGDGDDVLILNNYFHSEVNEYNYMLASKNCG